MLINFPWIEHHFSWIFPICLLTGLILINLFFLLTFADSLLIEILSKTFVFIRLTASIFIELESRILRLGISYVWKTKFINHFIVFVSYLLLRLIEIIMLFTSLNNILHWLQDLHGLLILSQISQYGSGRTNIRHATLSWLHLILILLDWLRVWRYTRSSSVNWAELFAHSWISGRLWFQNSHSFTFNGSSIIWCLECDSSSSFLQSIFLTEAVCFGTSFLISFNINIQNCIVKYRCLSLLNLQTLWLTLPLLNMILNECWDNLLFHLRYRKLFFHSSYMIILYMVIMV